MKVLYRMCPFTNSKPRPYGNDKYLLVDMCFRSFVNAFESVEPEIVFILDAPDKKLLDIIKDCPFPNEIEEYKVPLGNFGTYKRQVDIARESEGYVLLLEDDYLWGDRAGEEYLNALVTFNCFVTPYDHPGIYMEDYHKLWKHTPIRVTNNHHYQQIRSTTLTFGGNTDLFRENYDALTSYGIADDKIWADIEDKTPLLAPIPSLATHMERDVLAPVINWEKEWQKYL